MNQMNCEHKRSDVERVDKCTKDGVCHEHLLRTEILPRVFGEQEIDKGEKVSIMISTLTAIEWITIQ